MSECYRKQFQLNNIRTSCIFLSRRSRIVITNLFKKILLRKSASMKVCFYIMEKLYALNHLLQDVLSKRKYFISERLSVKQIILEDWIEHFATRLDSLQTLPTVAKSFALDMAGVLKCRLVTKANGDRDY